VPLSGVGYGGVRRVYGLEQGRVLETGTVWSRVLDVPDQVAGQQPEQATFARPPVGGENALYRVRVWLERQP